MIRCGLYDSTDKFVRHMEIADGEVMPELLTVDDYHYVRIPSHDEEPRFRLTVGHHIIHSEAVPIYVARLFTTPIEHDVGSLRLFSGHHGAVPFNREFNEKLSWFERVVFQVRGLMAVRINGLWCPELSREPGRHEEKAFLHSQASQALLAARRIIRPPEQFYKPRFRFKALGLDEYGRTIIDLLIFHRKANAPDVLFPFATAALKTGHFLPTRLVTEDAAPEAVGRTRGSPRSEHFGEERGGDSLFPSR